MQEYQYVTHLIGDRTQIEVQKALIEYGREGWQLICVADDRASGTGQYMILCRPYSGIRLG